MAISGPTQGASTDDPEVVEAGAFTEINIVPLVDIMLVLLVILMATSTAILESGQGAGSGFRVELPTARAGEATGAPDNLIVVAVLEDGSLVANEQLLSPEELQAFFEAEAQKDEARLVLVQAHEEAAHKFVILVMDAAKSAGLKNLALASKPEE